MIRRCFSLLLLCILSLYTLLSFGANTLQPWPSLKIVGASSMALQEPPSMTSHVFYVHYLAIAEVKKIISDNASVMLCKGATLTLLPKQHALWIYDSKKQMAQIKTMLATIDKPEPQIRMNARIITVDKNYLKSLGVDFGSQTKNLSTHDGVIHLTLGTLSSNALNATLTALETQGHATLISEPQLLTNNRAAAVIESGEEVPYQQTSLSGGTSVAFKKAVLKLAVTPSILSHQNILLKIDCHQDKLTKLSVNGAPIINTQQIKTLARINNNKTLVLGGILQDQTSFRTRGIPLLKRLPILGALFRHQIKEHDERDLLIFITPHIV